MPIRATYGRGAGVGRGLVVGEGAGAVILKRLDDAIRDGNEVYAVIKGVGMSSDGRDGHPLNLPVGRTQGAARQRIVAYVLSADLVVIEAQFAEMRP